MLSLQRLDSNDNFLNNDITGTIARKHKCETKIHAARNILLDLHFDRHRLRPLVPTALDPQTIISFRYR